jgi:hypothetical protein
MNIIGRGYIYMDLNPRTGGRKGKVKPYNKILDPSHRNSKILRVQHLARLLQFSEARKMYLLSSFLPVQTHLYNFDDDF